IQFVLVRGKRHQNPYWLVAPVGITQLAERRALVEGPVVPAARGRASGLVSGRAVRDEERALGVGEDEVCAGRPVSGNWHRRAVDLIAGGPEGGAAGGGRAEAGRPNSGQQYGYATIHFLTLNCGSGGIRCVACDAIGRRAWQTVSDRSGS